MDPNWKRFILPLCLVACAHGADWAPIPPEVWALKEDPAKGIKDAIILEKRTIFNSGCIERVLRVRILSDAGRKAVELPEFSRECCDFRGRTVYPDGRSVTFDKDQDFRKESIKFGDLSENRTIVIPPGITGNCVMELRWNEDFHRQGGGALPARMGLSASFPFGSQYLTLLEAIELPYAYNWSFDTLDGKTVKLEKTDKEGCKTFVARNIPPLEFPPYALSVTMDRPVFQTYYRPQFWFKQVFNYSASIRKEGNPLPWGVCFWNVTGLNIGKPRFETDIQKWRAYRIFRERIIPKIQAKTPHAFAAELIPLLEGEILNTSCLTHEEFSKWDKGQKVPDANDLEAICRTRTANGMGMMVLFYHLLVDAGFSPKVTLLADREQRLFDAEVFNPWQFSAFMIALEEPGKGMAYFDPSQRLAPLGLINPNYQGVQGLLLDPKAKWTANPFGMPVQPATFNRRHYEYTLDLAEEEDRFQLSTRFSGYPEFLERRRYLASDQGEQDRSLKERMEKGLKGASITRAQVLDAVDPKKTVTWKVDGILEREAGRQRKIEPFPGMQSPLFIPDSFPRERSLAIVMPYLQIHTSRSTIKVPKGFRLDTPAPFEQQNRLGRVSWSMKVAPAGGETVAVVTLIIGVDAMFAGPEAYGDLKNFLDWVSQACRRTLILEKV